MWKEDADLIIVDGRTGLVAYVVCLACDLDLVFIEDEKGRSAIGRSAYYSVIDKQWLRAFGNSQVVEPCSSQPPS